MKGSGTTQSRASPAWRAARRAGSSIAVAVVVALVGSRVNPADAGRGADSPPDEVLLHRISRAEVDMRSLRGAADSLGRAAGDSITVDEQWSNGVGVPDDDGVAPLRVTDRPLGWALGRVLAEFDPSGAEDLSYELLENRIRVGSQASIREGYEVRAYPVGYFLAPYVGRKHRLRKEYAGIPETDARQEAADQLVRAVLEFVRPTLWRSTIGGPEVNACMVGDHLVVTGLARAQRDVARFLFVLRHPAPLGMAEKGADR